MPTQSMTPCSLGDVVLVRFPFTDLTATNKRPAIVISPAAYQHAHGDIVIVALTGQDQEDPRLEIKSWGTAGLAKRTWVKPLIGTIAFDLIERRIGELQKPDYGAVKLAIAQCLDDRIYR